jgi:hypothetical protein
VSKGNAEIIVVFGYLHQASVRPSDGKKSTKILHIEILHIIFFLEGQARIEHTIKIPMLYLPHMAESAFGTWACTSDPFTFRLLKILKPHISMSPKNYDVK